MGNSLSASVPSLIQPVEFYVSDLPDVHFVASLGSTRFMKVAKVLHNQGPCVCKVFVTQDPTLSLDPYRQQLEKIATRLKNAPNCCPFRRTTITDKAALLLRPCGHETLFDRLNTRPFLTPIEKQWLAFQLLKALEQCHNAHVCHGDIKSQNVLVSSSGWVQLADFAPYKPAFLPRDNPSDFSLFFDASRRRTCNVAPERFVSGALEDDQDDSRPGPTGALLLEQNCTADKLTHRMDIFALGCVLVELWSKDGASPFAFSQLLSYRSAEDPSAILDPLLRSALGHLPQCYTQMVSLMLDRDPRRRPSATELLSSYRESIFPCVFYDYLFDYVLSFHQTPTAFVDDKLARLRSDMPTVLSRTGLEVSLVPLSLVCSFVRAAKFCPAKADALSLLVQLADTVSDQIKLQRILPYLMYMTNDVYARIRSAAIEALVVVLENVEHINREDSRLFLDYVFPKMTHLAQDVSSLTRVTLASHLSRLAICSKRYLELVSAEYGRCDPQTEEDLSTDADSAHRQQALREDWCASVDVVQELTVTLLCDADNAVKHALIRHGLDTLCAFFGKHKAGDVLLSHMITFLNDKTDWRLRVAFYEHCPTAANAIGRPCAAILKPLLQQGVRDFEETVVCETLHCLSELCRRGLLSKHIVYELLGDVVPFLAHPNEWLRVGAVGVLCALDRSLNVADLHCKVMPLVNPYLKQPLIKLDQQAILLRVLRRPLPRTVWELVCQSSLLLELLDFLRDKHFLWKLTPASPTTLVGPISGTSGGTTVLPQSAPLSAFYRKLLNQGLNENNEHFLFAFTDILTKMRRMRASVSDDQMASPRRSRSRAGVVDLSASAAAIVRGRTAPLVRRFADLSQTAHRHATNGKQDTAASSYHSRTHIQAANEEWQHMFGSSSPKETLAASETTEPPRTGSPSLPARDKEVLGRRRTNAEMADEFAENVTDLDLSSSPVGDAQPNDDPHDAVEQQCTEDETDGGRLTTVENSKNDPMIDTRAAMDTLVMMSSCRRALSELVEWKRHEWQLQHGGYRPSTNHDVIDSTISSSVDTMHTAASQNSGGVDSWSPSGRLVAQLNEHRAAVNRLSTLQPNCRLLASASSDGSVRLWDTQHFEGSSLVNQSRAIYRAYGNSRVRSVVFMGGDAGECRAVCCGDSTQAQLINFHHLRHSAGPTGTPLQPEARLTVHPSKGNVLDVCTVGVGSSSLVTGVTHHGHLVMWDLRCNPTSTTTAATTASGGIAPVWQAANPSKHGLVTAVCIDPRGPSPQWAALGTAAGVISVWDIRFQLSVNDCRHPAGRPVVRLWPQHPTDSESAAKIWCSFGGNGETSLWDLETASRLEALWPSTVTAPLSYQKTSSLATTALCCPKHSVFTESILSRDCLITGDSTGVLRLWDRAQPKACRILSADCSNRDSKRRQRLYKRTQVDGIPVLSESDPAPGSSTPGGASGSLGGNPATSTTTPLDIQVTTWHKDSVSDVICCHTGNQPLLVTSSRDGIIKVWK